MAIYHCSIKNISRSKGKSAVAAAAYRAAEKIKDDETGLTHNYTKKSEVIYSEIILPENAPTEYKDRSKLWNEVQKTETQSNARLAREWEIALPNELDLEQSKELVQEFAKSLAAEGMCIDVAIHWKNGNHHAHILGTTRPIDKNGKWGQKEKKAYKLDAEGKKVPVIDTKTGKQKIGARGRKMWQRETVAANNWNKREKVEEWRKRWADYCNKYLSKEQQLDYRSYERQGLEQLPTVHEGYAARQMESIGKVSDLCQLNRDIKRYNRLTRHGTRLKWLKGRVIIGRAKRTLSGIGATKPSIRNIASGQQPVTAAVTGSTTGKQQPENGTYSSVQTNTELEQLRLAAQGSAAAQEERRRADRDEQAAAEKARELAAAKQTEREGAAEQQRAAGKPTKGAGRQGKQPAKNYRGR